jgi:hypothetical protein
MDLLRPIPAPYRTALVALAASAALHGIAIVGVHVHRDDAVNLEAPSFTATLEEAPLVAVSPEAQAAPAPRVRAKRAARPKNVPRPEETIATLPPLAETSPEPLADVDASANVSEQAQSPLPSPQATAATAPAPAREPEPEAPPLPEVVALAKPAAVPAPAFRPEALPARVDLSYALTSAFAEGTADYTWRRKGDRYEISGSASATGFFALFLEGRIDQESSGVVTAEGLRPDSFTERRGNTPPEGLTFDWNARVVEFRRGSETKTGPLTDSTVDWLSMIFQLAHNPPQEGTMELRVFTQRRLYQYHLEVLGTEEIQLPFGPARTLHLRHEGEKPEERVDVWLGVDQHYLPVKLRYPVARNRLVVEQTATSITAR